MTELKSVLAILRARQAQAHPQRPHCRPALVGEALVVAGVVEVQYLMMPSGSPRIAMAVVEGARRWKVEALAVAGHTSLDAALVQVGRRVAVNLCHQATVVQVVRQAAAEVSVCLAIC